MAHQPQCATKTPLFVAHLARCATKSPHFCGALATDAPQKFLGWPHAMIGVGLKGFLWRTWHHAPQKVVLLWRTGADAPQKVGFFVAHGAMCATKIYFCGALAYMRHKKGVHI